ncbi:MAG: hypothetical protein EKK40_13335 [Bradyrhizobiaceae bacterium]|nr:MAG: hypothetical protein EKK40_13335 [Bradyrhizobiaceae bacterium]
MIGPDVKLPKHVLHFEVCLYLSLLIDSLTAALLDTMPEDISESGARLLNLTNAVLILFVFYMIWLAAHRRKGWARMVLVVFLLLSTASLVTAIGENGVDFGAFVDLVSVALSAVGLGFSYTGDAKGWFDSAPV